MATFPDGSTRGEHPRYNCAARRLDNTENSNVLMSSGRLIMQPLSGALRLKEGGAGNAGDMTPSHAARLW
jgi:hypothetical protein